MLQSTKLKGVGDVKSVLMFDKEMQILSAGFQSYFDPVFPHYIPYPMF